MKHGSRIDNVRPGDRSRNPALERGIAIALLLVQGAAMPGEEDLPPSLRSLVYYNAIAIRPDPDFHQDMTRLIKGMEAHIGEKIY